MKSKSSVLSTDFWFGIVSLVVLIAFWTQTGKLSAQVKVMPRVVLAIGIVSDLLVIAKALKNPVAKEECAYNKTRCILTGFVVFAIVALLLAFSSAIGMYLSLFLSIVAISVAICVKENGWNWKKIGFFILYDLIVTAILFLFFRVFLSINTPTGILI